MSKECDPLIGQPNIHEKAYRKRFPKGKDWKEPQKNPFGFCGLNEDSYHGMETIAISIGEHEKAEKEINRLQVLWAEKEDEIRKLKKDLEYFREQSSQKLNKALSKCVTFLNQELQSGNDRVKLILKEIGVTP
ncbi:hypothetical protein H8D85_02415 [bacterium]|nr:hypothetical protein [bacterium]